MRRSKKEQRNKTCSTGLKLSESRKHARKYGRFGIKAQVFPDGSRGVYLPGVPAISRSVGAAAAAAVAGYLAGETDAAPGIKYGPLTASTSRSLLKRLNDIGICLVHQEKMYNENNPPLKRII